MSLKSTALTLVAAAATFVGTLSVAETDPSVAAVAAIAVGGVTHYLTNQQKPAVAVEASASKKKKTKAPVESVSSPKPVESVAKPAEPVQKKAKAEAVAAPKSDKVEKKAEKKVEKAPVAESSSKKAKKPAAAPAEEKKSTKAEPQPEQKSEKKKKSAAAPTPAPQPVFAQPDEVEFDSYGNPIESEWIEVKTRSSNKSASSSSLSVADSQSSSKKSSSSTEKPLTDTINLDSRLIGMLMGNKAEKLNMLQVATETEITVPKKDAGSSVRVQVTGLPSDVQRAIGALDCLIKYGYCSFTHPGSVHDTVNVDPSKHAAVIGERGSHIQKLQKTLNVRINMPEAGQSKIVIIGQSADVHDARAAIKSLVEDGFSNITHEGFVKLDIPFPADKIGALVGPKGQTIKSIQGNTETRINTGNSGIVSVIGKPEGVAKAEKHILDLLEPEPYVDPMASVSVDGPWSFAATVQGENQFWTL